jgi:hypothetical protein
MPMARELSRYKKIFLNFLPQAVEKRNFADEIIGTMPRRV